MIHFGRQYETVTVYDGGKPKKQYSKKKEQLSVALLIITQILKEETEINVDGITFKSPQAWAFLFDLLEAADGGS